jgi:PqqD family protein of HPr-rel-A system
MKIKENIALSESGFVFDASTGESYQINEVGNRILSYLKEDTTEEVLKTRLMEEYDVDADDLDRYLYDFLRKLDELSLLSHG